MSHPAGPLTPLLAVSLAALVLPSPQAQGQQSLTLPEPGELPEVRAAPSAEIRNRLGEEARSALAGFYMNPNERYGMVVPVWATTCDADEGQDCYYGDPDALPCNHGFTNCRPRVDGAAAFTELLRKMLQLGARAADDPFVIGQAVYTLAKGNWFPQALHLAENCRAERWWCLALEGWVYDDFGDNARGAPLLLQALETMPSAEACRWRDIESLLPRAARADYREASCAERREIEDRAWWLADPVYLDETNDRFLEHLARRVSIELHEDLWSLEDEPLVWLDGYDFTIPYRPQTDWREYRAFDGHVSHHETDQALGGHHRGVVAIGFPDSWYHDGTSPSRYGRYRHWRQWVSDRAARYRFFPDADVLQSPASARPDSWSFEEGDGWERYTPAYGLFSNELEFQVALFRRADSMVVALATDLDTNEHIGDRPRVAGLVLARDEHDSPAVLLGEESRTRYVFRATRPDTAHLASLEVIAPERVARSRFGIHGPWSRDRSVTMSDILLYEPFSRGVPDSLAAAVATMKGTAHWEQGRELGVYWELYGLDQEQPVRVSVRLGERRGGLFRRLGQAIRLVDDEALEVGWVDADLDNADGIFPRAFTLDLGNVGTGSRVIEVRIEVEGQEPIVRRREIEIVEPSPGG